MAAFYEMDMEFGSGAGSKANPDDNVRSLQQSLLNWGFDPGPIDGIFGPRTAAATSAMQALLGVSQSGAVDAQTLSAIRSDLAKGPSSRLLQHPGAVTSNGGVYIPDSGGSSSGMSTKVKWAIALGAIGLGAYFILGE